MKANRREYRLAGVVGPPWERRNPAADVETPEGYRLTHVSARGGAASIDLLIPEEWEERKPGSNMRLPQLVVAVKQKGL